MPIPSSDFLIQSAFLLITLAIFLSLLNLPKKALRRLRSKSDTNLQSNRHFFLGAHLLTRAKSSPPKNRFLLAKSAIAEADKALAYKPKDPAAHILKGLAQDLLGYKSAAIKSLDAALSRVERKGLSDKEKADALAKRAELVIGLNRRRRVDSAIEDLVEAVQLRKNDGGVDAKVFCLLGRCYEVKGMKDEAVEAFEDGLKVEPESKDARDGLARLKA